MKIPTLEEVKEHFKDAKEVECLYNQKKYNISLKILKDIHLFNDKYWVDLEAKNNSMEDVLLWEQEKGFAKILSIKKSIISNELTELEKRVEVLKNKVDLKKITDLSQNHLKSIWMPRYFPIGRIPIPDYSKDKSSINSIILDFGIPDSHNDILTPKAIEPSWLSEVFGVPKELLEVKTPNISAFKKTFDSISSSYITENTNLKMRIEQLEAENKEILSGGKSKWEKEIDELKEANHKLSGNVNFWQKECASLRDFVEAIKNQSHKFLGMK